MRTLRGVPNTKWPAILWGMVLWVLLWTLPESLSAQDLRGKVCTTDENGDTVAVYMARLQWLNTTVGTYTNARGLYKLPFAQTDTLIVSYALFPSDTIVVKRNETYLVICLNRAQTLQEVVVSKKRKQKYVRKGNPAVELVEKVIEHKNDNRIETTDHYKSKVYTKTVMSFGRFKMDFQKNGSLIHIIVTGKINNASNTLYYKEFNVDVW